MLKEKGGRNEEKESRLTPPISALHIYPLPYDSTLHKTSRRESVVCQHTLSKLESPWRATPKTRKALLWQSAALALLAALSLISRVDWQKNQPQQNVHQFDATTSLKCKTNAAGWHDAEKESKILSTAQSTWQTDNFASKPSFYAWCHSFLFKSIPAQPQYGAELFFVEQRGRKNNGVTFCGRFQAPHFAIRMQTVVNCLG